MIYIYYAGFRIENGVDEFLKYMGYVIEIIFAIDIVLCFFKEYIPTNSKTPVNSFS